MRGERQGDVLAQGHRAPERPLLIHHAEAPPDGGLGIRVALEEAGLAIEHPPGGRPVYTRFDAIDARHRDANVESIFYYAVFYPAVEAIGALAGALIIWYGGAQVMNETVTLGALVAFLQYSQRFFRPLSDMSEKFNVLQSAMASSERIFKLLDTEVTIESSKARSLGRSDEGPGTNAGVRMTERASDRANEQPPRPRGHIIFDHVWFAYNDDDFVLHDVSFEVRPGERIGVVGATGSGKTTLINLLLRFYDVRRGRILIDGVDIREMPLDALRRMFSLVLQDVHLFSGTIADNIRLGSHVIGDADVRRAAATVHADRFIEQLPQGESTYGRDHLRQRLAGDVFHRDEMEVPLALDRVHRDDVWMIEGGYDARFGREARAAFGVGGGVGEHELQRHLPAEHGVLREVDLTHATPAELPQDPVMRKHRSGGQHRARG